MARLNERAMVRNVSAWCLFARARCHRNTFFICWSQRRPCGTHPRHPLSLHSQRQTSRKPHSTKLCAQMRGKKKAMPKIHIHVIITWTCAILNVSHCVIQLRYTHQCKSVLWVTVWQTWGWKEPRSCGALKQHQFPPILQVKVRLVSKFLNVGMGYFKHVPQEAVNNSAKKCKSCPTTLSKLLPILFGKEFA